MVDDTVSSAPAFEGRLRKEDWVVRPCPLKDAQRKGAATPRAIPTASTAAKATASCTA
jgi:hypothetical protein